MENRGPLPFTSDCCNPLEKCVKPRVFADVALNRPPDEAPQSVGGGAADAAAASDCPRLAVINSMRTWLNDRCLEVSVAGRQNSEVKALKAEIECLSEECVNWKEKASRCEELEKKCAAFERNLEHLQKENDGQKCRIASFERCRYNNKTEKDVVIEKLEIEQARMRAEIDQKDATFACLEARVNEVQRRSNVLFMTCNKAVLLGFVSVACVLLAFLCLLYYVICQLSLYILVLVVLFFCCYMYCCVVAISFVCRFIVSHTYACML